MNTQALLILICNTILLNGIAQSSTISVVSEKETFTLFLNAKQINETPGNVAIGPAEFGRNHLRLAFAQKGVPELSSQIEIPYDEYYHQLSYKVVPAPKGPYSLVLISDVKLGKANSSASTGNAKPGNQSMSAGDRTKKIKSTNEVDQEEETDKEEESVSSGSYNGNTGVTITANESGLNMQANTVDSKNSLNQNGSQLNVTINNPALTRQILRSNQAIIFLVERFRRLPMDSYAVAHR